jgi:Cu-Zn family superoxide dismutase
MPNIHVPETGKLHIEVLNQMVHLTQSLLDADGSAIVIHQGPDDYVSDPAGDAGSRIACGVITK